MPAEARETNFQSQTGMLPKLVSVYFTHVRIVAANRDFPPQSAVQLRRFSAAKLTHRGNGFWFTSAESVAVVAEALERTEVAHSHTIMLWRFFKFNEREEIAIVHTLRE